MDPVVLAAVLGSWSTVAAAWISTHRRMNGSGPIAKKLDELGERLEAHTNAVELHVSTDRGRAHP